VTNQTDRRAIIRKPLAPKTTAPEPYGRKSPPGHGNYPRELEDLRQAILGCTRCPALVRSRSCVVHGHGAVAAIVAFVGIAPGRLGGDRTGVPFSGDRSGDLLRRMIRENGLRRVFITNLIRCSPRDDGGRNRDPHADEIANCRENLQAELALVRPRIVACLGRIAWRELAGRKVPFEPSEPHPLLIDGRLLYPMFHPGYAIRGAYPESSYRHDFARLAALAKRPPEQ
jgi:uracil-DNA glycosylase family 4